MSSANFSLEGNAGESYAERFEAGEIFVPLQSLTWVDFLGVDRAKVLGNLTTNQIARLEVGTGRESFITDARGKTFGHGIFFAMDDRIRLLTVADQFQRISAHVDRYVIREDVRFEDATSRVHVVFWPGVKGARLAGLLKLPHNEKSVSGEAGSTLLHWVPISGEGFDGYAYQVPWTRKADWLFEVPSEQLEAFEAWLVAQDILPGHESIMHCGRIGNRYPWFGLDCDENNLPQEMDRDADSIDFRKGCYLGQETIARLDAMGQVQKKLTLWQFEGIEVPPRGAEMRVGEKVVATVTSSAYCYAHGGPLALAMARRSHFAAGSQADTQWGKGTVIDACSPHQEQPLD